MLTQKMLMSHFVHFAWRSVCITSCIGVVHTKGVTKLLYMTEKLMHSMQLRKYLWPTPPNYNGLSLKAYVYHTWNTKILFNVANASSGEMTLNRQQDRGYAWVILAASFFGFMLHGSMISTQTLLYQALLHKFGMNVANTGSVVAGQAFVAFFSSKW